MVDKKRFIYPWNKSNSMFPLTQLPPNYQTIYFCYQQKKKETTIQVVITLSL